MNVLHWIKCADEEKSMKVIAPSLAALSVLVLGAPAAQDASGPPPKPAQVRVHVSADGRFLDDLKLADFSLLEAGRPQSLIALSLVRGGQVLRQEGTAAPASRVERTYNLLFQAVDWDPKLEDAIDHLFASVLKPGDAVTLVTPFKPYHLQKDALTAKSKAELSKSMQEVLRKDIVRGGGEYRQIINELKRLTNGIGGSTTTFDEDLESDISTESGSMGLEMQIDRYRQDLMKLEAMRLVDEAKLLAFAGSLKAVVGQKTVFLFYQREYRPEINSATMNTLMSLYQDNPDILGNLMDLFQFYKREQKFDATRAKRAFADAGIDFHVIFMEKKNQRVFGATMREQSEDTFPVFVEIARATGGTSDSASNPAAGFKRAADTSGDYYILSYIPENAARDGAFRTVEVKVGREAAKVANPLGYYAR
jgi:hypothetical protein